MGDLQKQDLRSRSGWSPDLPEVMLPCSTLILADRDLDNGGTTDMSELNSAQKKELRDLGVVLALTKPDSTVINQSGVYRLMRSTGADPWTIADSGP